MHIEVGNFECKEERVGLISRMWSYACHIYSGFYFSFVFHFGFSRFRIVVYNYFCFLLRWFGFECVKDKISMLWKRADVEQWNIFFDFLHVLYEIIVHWVGGWIIVSLGWLGSTWGSFGLRGTALFLCGNRRSNISGRRKRGVWHNPFDSQVIIFNNSYSHLSVS